MSFDPTTNRIPYGLLTPEEQATLKAWPHGWEVSMRDHMWGEIKTPNWISSTIYRGKPAPKVTCYWFSIYNGDRVGNMRSSKGAAETLALDNTIIMRMEICNGEVTVTKET